MRNAARQIFEATLAGVLAGLAVACAAGDYPQLYGHAAKAQSYDDQGIAGLDYLGATPVDQGYNFSVYSERATRVELLLFDDPERERPTRQFLMHRYGNVWNVYVEGIGLGQHYGYVAWGPNWVYDPDWYCGSILGFRADIDLHGNRFNPNKLLTDPYARVVHRDHDWYKGSAGTGPMRTECTWDAASKAVIARSEYTWSPHEQAWRRQRKDPSWPGHAWQDLILYEVHPKGFTANRSSGVEHPGTFRGFGEKADYLADLGVTAVELMPAHEKPLDGGYWGYQSIGFFVPERTYAWASLPHEIIDEFKWMVDALHQRGIEVILDVVYNHTGEGGFWRERIEWDPAPLDTKEQTTIYSFRGFDHHAYYALDSSKQFNWNDTGVGNQTRCNHVPMRRLILDSLRYWVEEMHVDGFRFDLAPILGVRDLTYDGWPEDVRSTVLQDIIDDPVLRKYNTRIIAEPWSLAGGYLGAFPRSGLDEASGWYEWNGHFRDFWRSFVNEDGYPANRAEGPVDAGQALTGSDRLFAWNGRKPYHSVNFVTVHDGFTMFDLFSYAHKRNGCSPLNPICCTEPFSPFCDKESGESHNRSRVWECGAHAGDAGACNADPFCFWVSHWDGGGHCDGNREPMKRQQMRNLFTLLLVAQGTPMLLGGDEWMRTQLGNNNAYTTRGDNQWNWFQWGVWEAQDARRRMFDFVRKMIAFRKSHAYAFAPTSYAARAPLGWKTASNAEMGPGDWGGKHFMLHYYDSAVGPQLLILINMGNHTVDFALPSGVTWRVVVDTQNHFDLPEYFGETPSSPHHSANIQLDEGPRVSSSYGVVHHSVVILEECL